MRVQGLEFRIWGTPTKVFLILATSFLGFQVAKMLNQMEPEMDSEIEATMNGGILYAYISQ